MSRAVPASAHRCTVYHCRCRALLPTRAGPLLTGSTDCSVRLWDAAATRRSSYLVCAPPELPHPVRRLLIRGVRTVHWGRAAPAFSVAFPHFATAGTGLAVTPLSNFLL